MTAAVIPTGTIRVGMDHMRIIVQGSPDCIQGGNPGQSVHGFLRRVRSCICRVAGGICGTGGIGCSRRSTDNVGIHLAV